MELFCRLGLRPEYPCEIMQNLLNKLKRIFISTNNDEQVISKYEMRDIKAFALGVVGKILMHSSVPNHSCKWFRDQKK